MIELFEINKLINKGFSLITADKNKRPLNSWKDAQTNATDVDTFKSQFLSKGSEGVCGLSRRKRGNTAGVGCVISII